MPRVSPLQNSFIGGEWSPLLAGRVDTKRYDTALLTCKNYVPILQGALLRRPGTKYVANAKELGARLVSFEFSTTQAYILEFGDQYIRFFRNGGQILDPQQTGVPLEISTPYTLTGGTANDIFQLKFTQSADVLYITHPDYAPRMLLRTSHTSWVLAKIDFLDGPYLDVNTESTTLDPSGTTGSITLSASGPNGINGTSGFKSTDVGRLIRFKDSAGDWTWMEITAFTDNQTVDAEVKGPALATADSSSDWRLGVWSETTGFPAAVAFHENRLTFAGSTSYPQRVDMSVSNDYVNFAPTQADGTITDALAIAFYINANQVNAIRWLASDDKGLLLGTVGAEWLVRPATTGGALTPTNVDAKKSTAWGSANLEPVQIGQATIFVQRDERQVREINYHFEADGYRAISLTSLAEHITQIETSVERLGLVDIAVAKSPYPIIWAVRGDGTLVGCTYEREADVFNAGWHRHVLGGIGSSAQSIAAVQSVAVIPSSTGERDEVWMIVRRRVNGTTVRHIEYMTPFYDDETTAQEDQFFVDAGLTYDGSAATTISGLDHLEGETVSILADGAKVAAQTVSGGEIELDVAAEKVHVGLGYTSDGKMPRLEAGAADGTSLGKTRRIHRLGFLLWRTGDWQFGQDFDNLSRLVFRSTNDNLGEAIPLFTGIKSEVVQFDYDFNNTICWRQDGPVNGTLLAVMPQMKTEDRG